LRVPEYGLNGFDVAVAVFLLGFERAAFEPFVPGVNSDVKLGQRFLKCLLPAAQLLADTGRQDGRCFHTLGDLDLESEGGAVLAPLADNTAAGCIHCGFRAGQGAGIWRNKDLAPADAVGGLPDAADIAVLPFHHVAQHAVVEGL